MRFPDVKLLQFAPGMEERLVNEMETGLKLQTGQVRVMKRVSHEGQLMLKLYIIPVQVSRPAYLLWGMK